MTAPLPNEVDLEHQLIGACLTASSAGRDRAEALSYRLRPEHLYRPAHQRIWAAIIELLRHEPASVRPDPALVAGYLTKAGALDEVGGIDALNTLANDVVVPSPENAAAYARRIIESYQAREMMRLTAEAQAAAATGDADAAREILSARLDLGDLDDFDSDVFDVGDDMGDYFEWFESEADPSIPTGIDDLDNIIDGLGDGKMIVIGARPGMGKSGVVSTIAADVVLRDEPRPTLVFSLEMGRHEVISRMVSGRSEVPLTKITDAKRADNIGDVLSDEEAERFYVEGGRLAMSPLRIVDASDVTLDRVHAEVRKMTREHGRSPLVVIDYLQLMTHDVGDRNRQEEVSAMSRFCKKLAREFECPVVVLSQLSRNLEQRSDKRPILSDLRDSGAVEQDADVVIFLYRDELYDPGTPDKGVIELIVAKHRGGPIGVAKAVWHGKYTKVTSAANMNPGETPLDAMADSIQDSHFLTDLDHEF